ncbi:glycoside hydrolase family 13 protein [Streptomyces triticirhizae]|uniref:Glycoside hydrolase family 13 protein n=1 Tax=Streptomyces triticirhizae TaxID=2483353 RepID=A0A3M2LQS1_9ACTN|nr:glycoside hydrolase family 13 protein [Streptomyces triticirhizae]RMI39831.1 glycoside hydrolase family 13 protein [Streptomyces triticirhizae]
MPTAEPQPWWRDAVIYQIYVRSFADSDGDGVGDLPGITQRLDHIAALGADAVWLTPFYPSPQADGGYDVADYRDVDPRFGTLGDADALLARAHQLGLRVIVDIVANHTSDRHRWFQEALAAPPGDPARERYVFRDGREDPEGPRPPTDWRSVFGGPAWTRVPDGQWYLHLFAPEQPDLNWDNPEVAAEFADVLRFWLARGVDGFRFDVAHGMAKDLAAPLRDLGPDQVHHRIVGAGWEGDHPFWDRDEVHTILRGFRAVLDAHTPPAAAVGESWAEAARRARYTDPGELHQTFNFDFLSAGWDAAELREVIDRSLAAPGAPDAGPTWVLSNHDVVRHASRLALPAGVDPDAWLRTDGKEPALDPALATRRARAAALLLLALPGCAYLYQGEELGLPEVADLPEAVLADPVRLRSRGARKGRDGCRVPLPWERGGPSLGFGPGPGWLPQPADWAELSVAAQRDDPDSTLALYTEALRLRRAHAGGRALSWAPGAPAGVLDLANGRLRCVVNLGQTPVPLTAAAPLLASGPLGRPLDGGPRDGHLLPPDTAVWTTAQP